MNISVAVLHPDGKYDYLYEFIDNFKQAELLALLAMHDKSPQDLIVIFPGWNRGIKSIPAEYERAVKLAKKYRYKLKSRG